MLYDHPSNSELMRRRRTWRQAARKARRVARSYLRQFGPALGLRLWARALLPRVLPRNRLVTIRVPAARAPLLVRARTSDVLVFYDVFVEAHHAVPMRREPRLIIDAGANVGYASAYFASRFPGARIVALEVDAGNFAMLRRNVAPYSNVIARHAGVWTRSVPLVIENAGDLEWAFRVVEAEPGSPGAVNGISVADLLAEAPEGRVDLLKIDIEGSELELFSAGIDAWIDRVDMILVEIHETLRPGAREAVEAAMRDRGFLQWTHGEFDVFERP